MWLFVGVALRTSCSGVHNPVDRGATAGLQLQLIVQQWCSVELEQFQTIGRA